MTRGVREVHLRLRVCPHPLTSLAPLVEDRVETKSASGNPTPESKGWTCVPVVRRTGGGSRDPEFLPFLHVTYSPSSPLPVTGIRPFCPGPDQMFGSVED